MALQSFPAHVLTGDHASRPVATDVAPGTLYSCTDHGIIYQSNGTVWSNWATMAGVATEIAHILLDTRAPASHRHRAGEAEIPGLIAFITALLPAAVSLVGLEILIGAKAHASHRHQADEANLPGITALIAASAGSATDSDQNILANQIFGA